MNGEPYLHDSLRSMEKRDPNPAGSASRARFQKSLDLSMPSDSRPPPSSIINDSDGHRAGYPMRSRARSWRLRLNVLSVRRSVGYHAKAAFLGGADWPDVSTRLRTRVVPG